jgi:hypothetical protein
MVKQGQWKTDEDDIVQAMRNPEASYGTCHIGEGAREVEDAILDVY